MNRRSAESRGQWFLLAPIFCLVATGAAAASLDVENITVTARKRVERLDDVPLAITVITAADISQRTLETSPDIAHEVPSLLWHSVLGLATPEIFLRGVGNPTFNANQANPVGIHTDSIYQGSNLTYGMALFDLDQVEVLKGPQGTLFGRNTTGGVINFISRKPDVNAGTNAEAEGTYGRFNEADLNAATGFAIGDHVAVRIAGVTLNRDGYAADPTTGTSDGKEQIWATRGQVRLQDVGNFDLLLNVHGGENHSDVPPGKQIGVVCPPGVTVGQVGQCTDFFGFRDTTNTSQTFANIPSHDAIDTWGASATAKWGFDGFDVVSQTAVEANRRKLINDSDDGPLSEVKTSVVSRFHQVSEELRAASTTSSSVQWLVGGNFYSDRLTAGQNFTLNAFGPGGLSPFFPVQQGIASNLVQGTRSFAAFGEANVKFAERWTFTAGARWTSDQRSANTDAFIFDATGLATTYVGPEIAASRLLALTIPEIALSRTWDKWSGRGELSYQLTANALAYVQVSHGFKGGDFNGGALFGPAEATIANPEYVTDYEAGLKGSALTGQLTYGLAAYHYDFTDQQVAVVVPGTDATLQSLANAAKTRIQGLELEGTARPVEHLFLQANAGFLDAKFVSFQLDASNPATNYSGNRTPSSPKTTLFGSARYEIPVNTNLIALQADASYTGAHFFSVDNNPSLSQGGYWLANGRVSFEMERAAVAFWIKNISDRKYYVSGLGNAGLGFLEVVPGLPRTYGVTVSAHF